MRGGGCVNALFWWEATPPDAGLGPTLHEEDVQAAFGAASASFLGRGAFGETWRINDHTDRALAVKVVLNEKYPQALLEREVGGLLRVTDPRVVALQEVRTVDLAVGARPTLVFEFVDGGDVAGRIGSQAWPSFEDTHVFLQELLGAVAALHTVDTVHRDIKPENVALRGAS